MEIVVAFTRSEKLLEELTSKEEINMCEGSERIIENLKGLWRQEGELNTQRKILLKQLWIKFGDVSKELMMKIDKFNSQQLNMLVERIFDISSEDDILHLIN